MFSTFHRPSQYYLQATLLLTLGVARFFQQQPGSTHWLVGQSKYLCVDSEVLENTGQVAYLSLTKQRDETPLNKIGTTF